RRRHTMLVSGWSSDVCSSDLDPPRLGGAPVAVEEVAQAQAGVGDRLEEVVAVVERARRDPPGQVQEAEPEAGEEPPRIAGAGPRSEERRGGKEGRAREAQED